MTSGRQRFVDRSTTVRRGLDARSARTPRAVVVVWLLAAAAASAQPAAPASGTVAEVRIHGNYTTPDADVLAIAGDLVGRPATDGLVADLRARLDSSGRFEAVDVRRRFRSIASADEILLVIVVTERPGVSAEDLTPGTWKRFTTHGMFLPVLGYDDGYGFTYGARVSLVDPLGPGSRISAPLTWGGERQARIQAERTWAHGPVGRLAVDAGIDRRENPYFATGDTRTGVHIRAERAVRRWLRVGAGAGTSRVQFGDVEDQLGRSGADVSIDTRVDPVFPRNAVHATLGWERLSFDAGRAGRTTADLRGYAGLIGQSVVAVRALSIRATAPVPAYERSLLGGASTLRGYRAGHQANDSLAALSAELRVPLGSPMSAGRLGVKVFADAGTTYAFGARLRDQSLDAGYGAGVYAQLTAFNLSVDVARSESGSTRAHFGLGVTFK